MLTCEKCAFNNGTVAPQTKELIRQCVRLPPVMHLIPTSQGVVANVAYPVISHNFTACGEYYFEGKAAETLKESPQFPNVPY